MNMSLEIGTKVEIKLLDDADLYSTQWWPKRGVKVTGTIQKVFKNGKVAVAVDQIRNQSEDGRATVHFNPKKTGTQLIPLS